MLFQALVWLPCLSLLACLSGGTVLEVASLQPDRVLHIKVPFNATPNATNGNGTLVELMEEILPLDVVEIVLNMSVPAEVRMVEISWGFNWSQANVLNSRQAMTPVGVYLEHFQLKVEGNSALNVTIASNTSSNETEPLVMVHCTNGSTTFSCFFLVDIEALLPNGTADNETFMQISVPVLANFAPEEEVEFLFSSLAYNEDNYTESAADIVMGLMAVRPVLELTAGEPPSPGCPGDAVYLDTLVQHDINMSALDAFRIQLVSRSGSYYFCTTMSPRQIDLLEIAENATIPVGIILPYLTAGQHEPIIFIQYRDNTRGNRYFASDTTSVWIESYPAWDNRVQSSFVETSAEEVTVYEYFQLKSYVNTPSTNDTLVEVRACVKYPYSLSSGLLPVNILGVSLVEDAVEEAVAITGTLLDPSVGCWQGVPPLIPENCTCWDMASFTVPQMYSHTPYLLFTFRVAGEATQGERVTFTMSLMDNLTNGSCMVPSTAEQEIEVVEPRIVTIKSITLTGVGPTEPPTAQVNISVHHAVGSGSAAVNVTVVDELPGGLTLVGEEVSDPTRVQVTITGRSITFQLNETLLLGESVALSYWGTLDAQYYIAQSGVEQFLTTATDYTGVEHNAALLFSTWNFDGNGKLYSHTQDNLCIRITALPQARFSRLAVGWAATAGGGAGLAIFVICGLVYLKRQRLACCGQYSGVAPEGKEEDEIVGYTELEVNSCDWPMEHRQDPEGAHRDTTPSPPPAGQKEDEGGYLLLGEDLSYTKLLLQVDGAGYVVDRFTRLLAAELASIDREHANLMLTAYAAIATNCLSELPLSAGERKEAVKRFSTQCVLIVDSFAEAGYSGWEQAKQLATEAIASEAASLKHHTEEWQQNISSAFGGEGEDTHKALVEEWTRMQEDRMTALKEVQWTAALREQCRKETTAIFDAMKAVKQLYLSSLKELNVPDSSLKGEAAIRTIEWIALVGRHLNRTRAELQVAAVEHFARVAKFRAEADHLAYLSTVQVSNFEKHIRKAARALVKNDILEKEDAARMVEKVTVKWPQLEDKLAHIQVQIRSVENRETGSARGRREKALAEELARAKTSETVVEKTLHHWRALRSQGSTREGEEMEQKATEQLKQSRLEVYKETKSLLLDRRVNFSTKLLLRGVRTVQTRRLEDMYQSGEKEVLNEAESRRRKEEEELSQRLAHIKQQMVRKQEQLMVTLDYQTKKWTEEVTKAYNWRPPTANSRTSGGQSPLPEEQQQEDSGVSLASCLLGELEVVWKEWLEGLKRKALWFEGELSNANQDGRGMKKELSKVLQGAKEYQVKNEVLDSRCVAERETARSIEKELERAKCKLEGNVTRLAMENARQIVQLQEQQRSHEKLQYELLAEMLNKHKPPQEEVEGVIQQYNDDCQALMHKLDGEKQRQMEAVRAKIEERRLRKERAASKSPASMSATFSHEKQPRLKQLIVKYRWEIRMESIRREYQGRLKHITENTTRAQELKLLEAMNALDKRLTENFAKLGHIPMSNLKVTMEHRRSSVPQSGQGGGILPPLKEEGYPGAGLGAGPTRVSAPWQLTPGALPALPGKNSKLPPLHITLSKPQQHS